MFGDDIVMQNELFEKRQKFNTQQGENVTPKTYIVHIPWYRTTTAETFKQILNKTDPTSIVKSADIPVSKPLAASNIIPARLPNEYIISTDIPLKSELSPDNGKSVSSKNTFQREIQALYEQSYSNKIKTTTVQPHVSEYLDGVYATTTAEPLQYADTTQTTIRLSKNDQIDHQAVNDVGSPSEEYGNNLHITETPQKDISVTTHSTLPTTTQFQDETKFKQDVSLTTRSILPKTNEFQDKTTTYKDGSVASYSTLPTTFEFLGETTTYQDTSIATPSMLPTPSGFEIKIKTKQDVIPISSVKFQDTADKPIAAKSPSSVDNDWIKVVRHGFDLQSAMGTAHIDNQHYVTSTKSSNRNSIASNHSPNRNPVASNQSANRNQIASNQSPHDKTVTTYDPSIELNRINDRTSYQNYYGSYNEMYAHKYPNEVQYTYQNEGQHTYQNEGQPTYQNEGQPTYQNEGQPTYRNQGQPNYQNQGQHAYQNEGQPTYQNQGQPTYQNQGQHAYQNEGQYAYQNDRQYNYQNEGQQNYQNQRQNNYHDGRYNYDAYTELNGNNESNGGQDNKVMYGYTDKTYNEISTEPSVDLTTLKEPAYKFKWRPGVPYSFQSDTIASNQEKHDPVFSERVSIAKIPTKQITEINEITVHRLPKDLIQDNGQDNSFKDQTQPNIQYEQLPKDLIQDNGQNNGFKDQTQPNIQYEQLPKDLIQDNGQDNSYKDQTQPNVHYEQLPKPSNTMSTLTNYKQDISLKLPDIKDMSVKENNNNKREEAIKLVDKRINQLKKIAAIKLIRQKLLLTKLQKFKNNPLALKKAISIIKSNRDVKQVV